MDINTIQNLDTRPYRNPSVWGPSLWQFLHTIAIVYPANPTRQDKKWYKQFFDTLPHILPCSLCREHLKVFLSTRPVRLESRSALVEYIFNLHNYINMEYKKKRPISFATAFRKYNHSCMKGR